MKRILPVVAAVTVFAAIGTVPAMASQAAPAQSAQTLQVVQKQTPLNSCGPCGLADANAQAVAAPGGGQYSVIGNEAFFIVNVFGNVNSPAGWPFSDHRFDSLYATYKVVQFVQQNLGGGCMQTDSVHSGVFQSPCGSHNAGTYWVIFEGGARGFCNLGAVWAVNVGITNHYPVYPYWYAMFVNSNNFIYTQSHRPIGGDDQWCSF